jgi:colanic acid biosynthesis glycosyl transferase WcaI
MSRPARPRLLVISQVYVPDAAAVGQYVADACEEAAARGWDVVVYTSARGYDDPTQHYPAAENRHGVTIRRLPLSSFGKRSIPIRLAAQLLFMLQASVRALFAGRFTSLLVSTSPPFAGFFGALLATVKRVPLTWWVMDLNPDQMVAAGRLAPSSVLARVFDWMNRVTIRKAKTVIVLDRYMKDRVVAKLPTAANIAAKVHVLPPWSLDTHLEPSPSAAREFRIRHGIDDAFVVMYAGNHSEQNPLDTLLAAADAMADRTDVKFVFVGGGAGKAAVDQQARAGSRNIVSLPYQPIETLAAMLAAADLHAVSVGDAMVGIVHPCKIYSAMAVARPILVLGPDRCHASDIVADAVVAWHVRHGNVAAAVAAVTAATAMPAAEREEMGRDAAEIVAHRYSRAALIDRFLSLAAPQIG